MPDACSLRAACLTPSAAGGIAVIQIVGPEAWNRVRPLLRTRSPTDGWAGDPTRLHFCQIVEGDQVLDDVVVAVNRTADGRELVELNLHGGTRLVERVLMLLCTTGISIATADEHTVEPASASSRFDREWTQALLRAASPQVADWLIRARTAWPRSLAAFLAEWQRSPLPQLREVLHRWYQRGKSMLKVLEGVRVVLLGPPNAGKSTLANALAGREAAIVHPAAGTTRDWTEHPTAFHGVPVICIDTAGLRSTDDPVEQEAIRRAREQAVRADCLLWVVEARSLLAGQTSDAAAVTSGLPQSAPSCPVIVVANKGDLLSCQCRPRITLPDLKTIVISALTGEGIEELRDLILKQLNLESIFQDPAGPFHRRQVEAIGHALAALGSATPDIEQACQWLKSVTADEEKTPPPGAIIR